MKKPDLQVLKKSIFHRSVNVFLYFIIGLIVLFLIVIGFTQTSTFREYLKETLVEELNSSINGKISLESIEGTIFSSLILNNLVLEDKSDTIIAVKRVEVKFSPLHIFLKRINVRLLEITDADIRFLTDVNGDLNIAKVFPPSEETDTTSSEFPFTILLREFNLINSKFSLQSDSLKKSNKYYDELTTDDFRIDSINLSLGAFANISSNDFEVGISKFSFSPNLNNFSLYSLYGNIFLNEKEMGVRNLSLQTKNSKAELNVVWQEVNLFDTTFSQKLIDGLLSLNLKVEPFSFSDLSTFVPAVEFIKGDLNGQIIFNGTLKELELSTLNLCFNNTCLNGQGYISNVTEPEKMFISINLNQSVLNYDDINLLMPSLQLPKFSGLMPINIDTLSYSGGILNSDVDLFLKTGNSSIGGKVIYDLNKQDFTYDIKLNGNNFNIAPFANFNSSINFSFDLKGSGQSINSLNFNSGLTISSSYIEGEYIKSLSLNSSGENKIIKMNISASKDVDSISLIASLDFNIENKPQYEMFLDISNFNFSFLINDTTQSSKLNAALQLKGENFTSDFINADLKLFINNTQIEDKYFDKFNISVNAKSDSLNKQIKLSSNFIDAEIKGKFLYEDFVQTILKEVDGISTNVKAKINEFFPGVIAVSNNSLQKKIPFEKNFPIDLEYNFKIKDLTLLSSFIDDYSMNASGEISGSIINSEKYFHSKSNFNFPIVKFISDSGAYFISDSKINLSLYHPANNYSINGLDLSLGITAGRVFVNDEFQNIVLDASIKKNTLETFASIRQNDKIKANISFSSLLSEDNFTVNINSILAAYEQFELKNSEKIDIKITNASVELKNFNLFRGDAKLFAEGTLSTDGQQDFDLSLEHFRGYDISYSLLGVSPENVIDYDLNLTAKLSGTTSNPLLSIKLDGDSISFGNKNFGSLKGIFDYRNETGLIDIKFLEKGISVLEPSLSISGILPLDLRFENVTERLPSDRSVDLKIFSKDFNLAAIGDALPFVDKLRGIMNANIAFTGPYKSLERNGNLSINNAGFLVESNNIDYNFGLILRLDEQSLFIDSLSIANSGNVPEMGVIRGRGKIEFEGMDFISMQLLMNGNLTVLTNQSKAVSPQLYGTLVIATEGDVIFVANKERAYLRAPIQVKDGDLTFSAAQSSYSNGADNFIYKFVEDTMQIVSQREQEFLDLIAYNERRSKETQKETKSIFNFDYDIHIKIPRSATFNFILAKEANQKLIARLNGDLRYERNAGFQNVQGELKLLEGSSLSFLKTFSAQGSIKFESELTNPILDITATYQNYYIDPRDSIAAPVPVAVKLKLKGALNNLSKTFASMDDNIAVYYGEENIQNGTPSGDKDKSDAVWFVLTGKFTKDLTSTEKSSAVGQSDFITGTATSLAGSLLGGLLNEYLGDYVRSFEITSVGTATKFNLSGSVSNFKYTIGGSTNVFQDLSSANIRIEYLITEKFLIRVERKEALNENTFSGEMINEMGLKYRFEF